MKKFIFTFILALVASLTFTANAQLNVKSGIKEQPQQVLTLQMAYSFVEKTELGYLVCMNTDNRFDRGYNMIFLGTDKASALQTAKDLKGIIEQEMAIVEVEQAVGNVSLMYKSNLGVKQLYVKQKGNAGMSWITLKQIEKIIAYFEKV